LNGVVHVINEVLLPPSLVLPATIGTIISGDDFATLKSALEDTGLFSSFVNSSNRYTIFAPSDSAFDAFELASPGTMKALLAEPDMIGLKEILLYHAVSPELVSSVDIVGGVESVETLQGENVSFTAPMGEMMSIMVDDANISTADVMALNGIVHIIDSIMTPSSVSVLPGIFQAANATGQFNTLLAAVNGAGLAESLNLPGPLSKSTILYTSIPANENERTRRLKDDRKKKRSSNPRLFLLVAAVFAPTDDAFGRVQGLQSILANPAVFSGLLSYHVVVGSYNAADLVDGMQLNTLAGKKVKVTVESDGTVMINNNAMVVQADIMGSNGVVHGIDTLLDPKDASDADVMSTVESTAYPTASPTDSPTDGAMMTNTVLAILSSLAVAAGIAVV
jgi:transforming growth factor-beta-induced protein